MPTVQWIKSQSKTWLKLHSVNLESVTARGVYVIWHAGEPSRTVRVGQGDIASRLNAHRRDQEISRYARFGELYVTWATVPESQMDGVERYLAETLAPQVGDAFPDCLPIAVNGPWG